MLFVKVDRHHSDGFSKVNYLLHQFRLGVRVTDDFGDVVLPNFVSKVDVQEAARVTKELHQLTRHEGRRVAGHDRLIRDYGLEFLVEGFLDFHGFRHRFDD